MHYTHIALETGLVLVYGKFHALFLIVRDNLYQLIMQDSCWEWSLAIWCKQNLWDPIHYILFFPVTILISAHSPIAVLPLTDKYDLAKITANMPHVWCLTRTNQICNLEQMCKNIYKCAVLLFNGGESLAGLSILDVKRYAKSVKSQWIKIVIIRD